MQPIASQPTGAPADYLDPNHPQFPYDVEVQPLATPLLQKKRTQITAIVLFVVLSIVAAALIGGKIGWDMEARAPPTEIGTVYTTTTTWIEPETLTITTTTFSWIDGPAAEPTPPPTTEKQPEYPQQNDQCTWTGHWPTKRECEAECVKMRPETGRPLACALNSGSYRCKICSPASAEVIPPPVAGKQPDPPKEEPKPEPPKEEAQSEPPKEEPKSEPPKEKGECFWVGRWSSKKECEDKCTEMNAKTGLAVVCGENRGFYQCQTCKTE